MSPRITRTGRDYIDPPHLSDWQREAMAAPFAQAREIGKGFAFGIAGALGGVTLGLLLAFAR